MHNFKEIEHSFKNHIDVAEKTLKNIGINIKDSENQIKPFEEILKEVANVFSKMNTHEEEIIKVYIIENMVGIRYSNDLLFIIYKYSNT